ISRRSTVAVSTFVPALNVRSTTWPVSTFLSLVRTKAPPLPGLTCWNSTTFHSTPSRSSVMPFLRSLVVAIGRVNPSRRSVRRDLETTDISGRIGPPRPSPLWAVAPRHAVGQCGPRAGAGIDRRDLDTPVAAGGVVVDSGERVPGTDLDIRGLGRCTARRRQG